VSFRNAPRGLSFLRCLVEEARYARGGTTRDMKINNSASVLQALIVRLETSFTAAKILVKTDRVIWGSMDATRRDHPS